MRLIGFLGVMASLVVPATGRAQVDVRVTVATPTIRFETAPQLVEVSPGVQVVPEYQEEVFFIDGWYWYRSGDAWFRTRDHRGGWVVVDRHEVPVMLVKMKPGKYKHYKIKGEKVKFKEAKVKEAYGPEGDVVKVKEKKGKKEKWK